MVAYDVYARGNPIRGLNAMTARPFSGPNPGFDGIQLDGTFGGTFKDIHCEIANTCMHTTARAPSVAYTLESFSGGNGAYGSAAGLLGGVIKNNPSGSSYWVALGTAKGGGTTLVDDSTGGTSIGGGSAITDAYLGQLINNGNGSCRLAGSSGNSICNIRGQLRLPFSGVLMFAESGGNLGYIGENGTTHQINISNSNNPICMYPNGGTSLTTPTTTGGACFLTNGMFTPTHFGCPVGTPSNTPGAGAGTGATVTVSGSDCAGTISVATAGTPSANMSIASVSFLTTWGSGINPFCGIVPGNSAAAALSGATSPFVQQSSTDNLHFNLVSGATGLTTGTTYVWNYRCSQ
jgi:hypothetical protein